MTRWDPAPSASLGISPAGSDARKAAQLRLALISLRSFVLAQDDRGWVTGSHRCSSEEGRRRTGKSTSTPPREARVGDPGAGATQTMIESDIQRYRQTAAEQVPHPLRPLPLCGIGLRGSGWGLVGVGGIAKFPPARAPVPHEHGLGSCNNTSHFRLAEAAPGFGMGLVGDSIFRKSPHAT